MCLKRKESLPSVIQWLFFLPHWTSFLVLLDASICLSVLFNQTVFHQYLSWFVGIGGIDAERAKSIFQMKNFSVQAGRSHGLLTAADLHLRMPEDYRNFGVKLGKVTMDLFVPIPPDQQEILGDFSTFSPGARELLRPHERFGFLLQAGMVQVSNLFVPSEKQERELLRERKRKHDRTRTPLPESEEEEEKTRKNKKMASVDSLPDRPSSSSIGGQLTTTAPLFVPHHHRPKEEEEHERTPSSSSSPSLRGEGGGGEEKEVSPGESKRQVGGAPAARLLGGRAGQEEEEEDGSGTSGGGGGGGVMQSGRRKNKNGAKTSEEEEILQTGKAVLLRPVVDVAGEQVPHVGTRLIMSNYMNAKPTTLIVRGSSDSSQNPILSKFFERLEVQVDLPGTRQKLLKGVKISFKVSPTNKNASLSVGGGGGERL